jgi:hypothetical protein
MRKCSTVVQGTYVVTDVAFMIAVATLQPIDYDLIRATQYGEEDVHDICHFSGAPGVAALTLNAWL